MTKKFFVSILAASLFGASSILVMAASEPIAPKHAIEDLETLYDKLKFAHPGLYSNVSKADYDNLYRESAADLSRAHSKLGQWAVLQRFTAFGNIAHARIDFPNQLYDQYREAGGLAIPLYPKFLDGKWIVSESFTTPRIPQDAVLLTIDEVSIDDWYDKMRQYISADSSAIAKSLLEFQFPQYFWLLNTLNEKQAGTVQIAYEHQGKVQKADIPLLSKEALLTQVNQRDQIENDDKEQPALRYSTVLKDGTAWLRPGPFYNAESPNSAWDPTRFHEFIDQSFENYQARGAKRLIIDLRNNPGGDNSFSDHLIAKFATEPFRFASAFLVRSSAQARASNKRRLEAMAGATEGVSTEYEALFSKTPYGQDFVYEIKHAQPLDKHRFRAPVFVLINQHSYSNAVSVAAIVKDYGFARLAGKSTSDYATTYGAMETFTLENTGYQVGFPKALIIRPSGDKEPGPVKVDIEIPNLDKLSDQEISEFLRPFEVDR